MADVDMQRLVVSLEAQVNKFQKAMDGASTIADRRSRQIEARFNKLNASATAGFARLGTAVAGALTVQAVQQFIDTATRIENALKVAGLAGDELTRVYERLKASALANAAPVESLVSLYSRASLVQKELGVSSDELLGFVDGVAVALRVSGRSAQQASGALLQLGQALGSGVVRAEEFNSILEGALPVAQAAAAGLTEAGGSVAKLRQLVIDGKVPSDAFFRAFEAGSVVLRDRVAGAQLTVAQTTENLTTSIIDAAGKMDDATGLSILLTGALGNLGKSVDDVGSYFERNRPRIQSFFGAFSDGWTAIEKWKDSFREKIGLTALDDFLDGTSLLEGRIGFQSDQINERSKELATAMGGLFNNAAKIAATDWEAATKRDSTIKPVSLKDFASPKGNAAAQRTSVEREIEQIRKRTAALQAEASTINATVLAQERAKAAAELRAALAETASKRGTAATKAEIEAIDVLSSRYAEAQTQVAMLQGIKSQDEAANAIRDEIELMGLYGSALTEARVQQELLNEAKRLGITLTPGMIATIEATARQTAELERYRDTVREVQDASKEMLSSFVSDMRQGVSATESLGNALNKLADRLIDAGLDQLITGLIGGAGSSLFGGAGSGGWSTTVTPFAKGGIAAHGMRRFAKGGVSNRAAIFGEAGPEAAIPLPDGRTVPVTLSMPNMPKASAAASQSISIVVSPVFQVQNGTSEGVDKMKSDIVPTIKKLVNEQIVETFNRNPRFARSGI